MADEKKKKNVGPKLSEQERRRYEKIKSKHRKLRQEEYVERRDLPEQIKDIYLDLLNTHGKKFRDGGEVPSKILRAKRKKKKDKKKYDEAYSTVIKPTDKKKKDSDAAGPGTGTKFSSQPGQKVKKLYWDPETKKYLPPPGVSEPKEAKAKGGVIRKYAHGGEATVKGKTQTGGVKKIQLSGKHWNKDIG